MHGCLIAETVGRLKWKLVMHGHWTLDVYATVTLRSWKLNALNGENVELLDLLECETAAKQVKGFMHVT